MITIFTLAGEDVLSRGLTTGSYEEDKVAFWQRLAERRADPEVTNEELWLWRRFADCCCCEIVNVDNFKRRFFLGISLRRDVVKAGKAARRSGIQVCQEVMSVWAEYGDAKPSAEQIQQIYKEELGDEEGGDDDDSDERLSVCKTTIVSALQIKRVILDEPQALASVLQADELLQDQSPYFKLTNLAIVAARVKQDKDGGLWCMGLMIIQCEIQTTHLGPNVSLVHATARACWTCSASKEKFATNC